MLCRVEFHEAPKVSESSVATGGATAIAVYVPATAIRDGSVWICDPDSLRAERREVSTSATAENLARIDSGIRPGEWVVAKPDGLSQGQRLKPLFNERP